MPRPTQLPTPMASTEIHAQDGSKAMSLDLDLKLPPSAFENTRSSSESEYTPPSPKTKPTRRTSTKRTREAKEQINLPPPPGRVRRIIEMKPSTSTTQSTSPASSKTKSESTAKKPTSASRKISRKTAHSLIERRRRGKMNDEFDVLKEMIPACESNGREMHKLEILKASVEYIRYLKECIQSLQGGSEMACCAPQASMEMENGRREGGTGNMSEEEDTDVEMEMEIEMDCGEEQRTPRRVQEEKIDPQLSTLPFNPPPTPKLSPAILPQPDRHFSISSVTSPLSIPQSSQRTSISEQRHFSLPSTQSQSLGNFSFAAPARAGRSANSSAFTSPLLAAQAEADQDATVALLMLNGEWPSRGHMGSRDESKPWSQRDRVDGKGGKEERGERRRGLSVRDLLSS